MEATITLILTVGSASDDTIGRMLTSVQAPPTTTMAREILTTLPPRPEMPAERSNSSRLA